ncbi:MAG: two-component sensor histidine kinase [Clostridium sp.]|nr:two-component sensor histidine kinase [Clostridium sp.]
MKIMGKQVFGRVSMRIPLILCFLFVTAIPLMIQARVLAIYNRKAMTSQAINDAQNRCTILANELSQAEFFTGLQNTSRITSLKTEIETTADVLGGRIVLVDANYKIMEDTFGLSGGKTIVVREVLKAFDGTPVTHIDDDNGFYYVVYPVMSRETALTDGTGGNGSGVTKGKGDDSTGIRTADGVMLLIVSTESIGLIRGKISGSTGLLQLLLMLAFFFVDVLLASLLLRPFRRLQDQLDTAADGNLSQEIDEDTYAETSDISDTVSRTINQLKAIDESRQEFVSNVSHELKTPITSIRVLADSLMTMENPPVELYQEFMEDISQEIDRESQIIEDLLTLVRMDRSNPDMNMRSVSINAMIEEILKRLRPLAKAKNIELAYESIREVKADIDEVKLSLAIMNLVENAIKYNREEGWVHVTLDADHRYFYVRVIDNGIGIPKEYQDHVFERFYRVDKARSRESGGTGLGLAITKNIVVLHRGAIRLQSEDGKGTTFTVRIPLNYIP